MKDKSLFAQILLLVVLTFLCVTLTFTIALFAGSIEVSIFNFENLNIANMIPIFILGGLITCFTIIITLLFTSRTLFHKIKKLFEDDINKDK